MQKTIKLILKKNKIILCPQPELNRRHTDLQSVALPTEL